MNEIFSPQRMNYEQVPRIAWKGKTFDQITSSIQKNNYSDTTSMEGKLLFLPPQLKIYRRELVNSKLNNCNSRISASIDEFNRPNGSIVNSSKTFTTRDGIKNTLDINLTNNLSERPGTCLATTTNGTCQDTASNALRRVRSAGMIKKQYNSNGTTPTYFTNTAQRLANRSLGYQQNQFHYLRQGNSNYKPGSAWAAENKYGSNVGLIYCPDSSTNYIPVYYKPNNSTFAQDGGVSSSSRIARLKYDTITNNGKIFTKSYGEATGNALSYGVQTDTYTIKDKLGFPNTCTPKFTKTEEGFRKCFAPPVPIVL
jgi:hypothetical protein